MRLVFLGVFMLFSLAAMAQQPVPNGSFESGNGDSASGWHPVSGDVDRILLQEFKIQNKQYDTEYAKDGKYFMRIATADTSINGSNLANVGEIASVFPYTDRPKYVVFDAMYLPQAVNDRFQVHIILTHWNTTTRQRDIVLNYGVNSDSNKAYYPWTKFSAPINYANFIIPDTMIISLNSAAKQAYYGVGTTFWVDDVQLTNTEPSGIIELKNDPLDNPLSIYPNPAVNFFNLAFSLTSTEDVAIELYDIAGRVVHSENAGRLHTGFHTLTINSVNLKSGVYICRVSAGPESGFRRVMITGN
jgi:hypothetical protein